MHITSDNADFRAACQKALDEQGFIVFVEDFIPAGHTRTEVGETITEATHLLQEPMRVPGAAYQVVAEATREEFFKQLYTYFKEWSIGSCSPSARFLKVVCE